MRRNVFMLLLALLVLAVLVGCGPSQQAQGGTEETGAVQPGTDQGAAAAGDTTTGGETAQAGEAPATTEEAPAGTGAGTAAVAFTELDADQSGALNQGEFDSALDRVGLMQSWDTDANGTISQEEMQAAQSAGQLGVQEGGTAASFTEWDANADGNLDAGELRAGMFAQTDGNSDGQITEEEWTQSNLAAGQS